MESVNKFSIISFIVWVVFLTYVFLRTDNLMDYAVISVLGLLYGKCRYEEGYSKAADAHIKSMQDVTAALVKAGSDGSKR